MGERSAASECAPLDVVLFGGDPGELSVGGDSGRAKIVRNSVRGVRGIRLLAVRQNHDGEGRQGRRIQDDHLTAIVDRIDGGLGGSGIFPRHGRSHETRCQESCAIAVHCEMPNVKPHGGGAENASGSGV